MRYVLLYGFFNMLGGQSLWIRITLESPLGSTGTLWVIDTFLVEHGGPTFRTRVHPEQVPREVK